LPYTIGKWWYGTKKHTKDGVMVESAGRLFKEYDEDMNEEKLVEILSVGEEIKELTGGDHEKAWANGEDATIEKRLVQAGLPEREIKALAKYDGWRRRALGLLWAYLYRVDVGSDTLENSTKPVQPRFCSIPDEFILVKLDVVPAAIALNRAIISISLAFGNLESLLASLHLSQRFIQAIAPGHSPLLQLPHFDEKIVRAVEKEGGKNHWTVQRLMSIPEDKRRKLCLGKGLLSEPQYQTAMTFARNLPALRVEAAFFKVLGEKQITPSSLITFVVKLRIVPPGVTPPPVDHKDLLDEDPDETDVEALLGRKGSRWSSSSDSSKPDASSTDLALAHAPFYPRDHHPSWYVFLGDMRQGKLVVPPQPITSFDKNPENFGVVTVKMQFQAPPSDGEYPFVMMCVSDSYLGVDTQKSVTLEVVAGEEGSKWEDVDDISEPDEGLFFCSSRVSPTIQY
jgi:translocation protein SEC63